ncbi:MAG: hypothetical protein ACOYKD_10360 [Anaerolineaceae bacterium]|jgi:hypothetical protein
MKTLLKILTPIILLFCISCDALKVEYKIDKSCSAPCWRGLHPGMSFDEVAANVYKMKEFDVEEKTDVMGYSSIVLSTRSGEMNILNFSEHTLRSIVLAYKSSKMKLPLSEVINNYGAPDHVIVWYGGRPMNSIFGVLCYEKTGISINLDSFRVSKDTQNWDYTINDKTNVNNIIYDNPDPTAPSDSVNDCKKPLDIALKHEWIGYGNYQSCNPDTNKLCAPYME